MPRLWRKLRMTQPWWLVTLILAVATTVLRLVVQRNAADDPVYAQKIRALSGRR